MRRNPGFALKKPEVPLSARAASFNPVSVQRWFDSYKEIITELAIQDLPAHIWNCDETGLQDHFVSRKVLGEVGLPCYEITANERGETTTLLASLNTAGEYGPLLIIFKGQGVWAEWLCGGAPRNTISGFTHLTPPTLTQLSLRPA
ncbi:hypothetical protein ABVT39_009449 [Epinephelus coioides]